MRVGFLGGIEAGIPAGRGWILNPFAIGGGAGPRTINVSVTPSDAFPSETNLLDTVSWSFGGSSPGRASRAG